MSTKPHILDYKRRRRPQLDPSSCEASAESNDERMESTADEESDVRVMAQDIQLPAITASQRKTQRGTTPRLNISLHNGDHVEATEDSSTTYDGDISSAPHTESFSRKSSHNSVPKPKHKQSSGPEDSEPMTSAELELSDDAIFASTAPAPLSFLSRLTPAQMHERVLHAIKTKTGLDGLPRPYQINPPPTGRPVRIYADGVFDLFHLGHAFALRQAKMFFPDVYLLVGVNSDELVRKHKSIPVMTSQERYESVRNCKWADEVIEDAPWVIDQEFLDQWNIDYVAHDEEPYASADGTSNDVYQFVKEKGMFLPTRRTAGISTSELLQRIVEGYREGEYDRKLIKIGHPELTSRTASLSSRQGSIHEDILEENEEDAR